MSPVTGNKMCVCAVFVVCLWFVCGVFVVCLWCVCGVCVGGKDFIVDLWTALLQIDRGLSQVFRILVPMYRALCHNYSAVVYVNRARLKTNGVSFADLNGRLVVQKPH